jgi:L-aspartate oxidase
MTKYPVEIVEHPTPIIIGSGIAGLTTALGLDGAVIITAASVGSGSSQLAQGGVAAAIGPDDHPWNHATDTGTVGVQIVDRDIADLVTGAAASQIDWFMDLGARFDTTPSGAIALGREAGHSASRIVHAGGDATGAEIMRVLRSATTLRDDISLLPRTRLIDLVRSNDRIVGALTAGPDGSITAHIAPEVVIATGGIGGIYRRSTNPTDVSGAGLAAAARQGAELADLEFVQFHPTALTSADHPAPLVTEALRGEGAVLVDETGKRFLVDVHPDAELAPRDIVSRVIWQHMQHGHRVFIDATQVVGSAMPDRFPTVFSLAQDAGIDARTTPIPVAPAEHFHMGGIAADASGHSSLDGLWAVGEVASTGLHGANRLASNSLLEGAVMGQRTAAAIANRPIGSCKHALLVPRDAFERAQPAAGELTATVRRIAWDNIGIVRSADGLMSAIHELDTIRDPVPDAATVATLIAEAALVREESRGAHFRSDYPGPNPDQAHRSVRRPAPVDAVELERTSLPVN